jgi:hypothetical protein
MVVSFLYTQQSCSENIGIARWGKFTGIQTVELRAGSCRAIVTHTQWEAEWWH